MSISTLGTDLANNIRLVFKSFLLRPIDPKKFKSTLPQLILTLLVSGLSISVISAYWILPIGGIDSWGIVSQSSQTLLLLMGLAFAAMLIRGMAIFTTIVIGVSLAMIVGAALAQIYVVFSIENWSYIHWTAAQILQIVPAFLVVLSMFRGPVRFRLLRASVIAGMLLGLNVLHAFYLPTQNLFTTKNDTSTQSEASYQRLDVENLYYSQPALMQEQTSPLRRGNPDTIDVFGVTIAGTAEQGVFLRETEAVIQILQANYQTQNRVIQLANSSTYPKKFPLANAPNFATSLDSLASNMNPDQDIAVLFLTSHGSIDNFSLSFWQANVNSLSAEKLADLLDASGIKNMVIVISACYSGSFIDDLKSPDRLIITASSAQNTSFGCSDQNDWTWWGRAYFDTALRVDPDFRSAFETARNLILDWENRDGVSPSDPQLFVGERINVHLDDYFAQTAGNAQLTSN